MSGLDPMLVSAFIYMLFAGWNWSQAAAHRKPGRASLHGQMDAGRKSMGIDQKVEQAARRNVAPSTNAGRPAMRSHSAPDCDLG
jgi:hypothetical protein